MSCYDKHNKAIAANKIALIPLKAKHLFELDSQDGQKHLAPYLTQEYAKALEAFQSYTATVNGRIIGCGGLINLGGSRALGWVHLDRNAGKYFVALHRLIKSIIDQHPARRIEADVDCEFEAGHRWMKLLGFRQECERRLCFRADGGDSALYAKVRQHG